LIFMVGPIALRSSKNYTSRKSSMLKPHVGNH